AGEGDRAFPDREAAHPQGAARRARRAQREHRAARYHAQDHQHRSGATHLCAGGARRVADAAAAASCCALGCRRGRCGGADVSARRVAWLLAAGVAVIAFAIWLSSRRHLERDMAAGALVLPGLEHHVNTVTKVTLRKADATRATLQREGDTWRV